MGRGHACGGASATVVVIVGGRRRIRARVSTPYAPNGTVLILCVCSVLVRRRLARILITSAPCAGRRCMRVRVLLPNRHGLLPSQGPGSRGGS